MSTFNPSVEYDQGDPVSIPLSDLNPEYQSSYVTKYNHLRDAGWYRENGKWVSPHTKVSYQSIHVAFQSQDLWEIQNNLKATKRTGTEGGA